MSKTPNGKEVKPMKVKTNIKAGPGGGVKG